MNTEQNYAPQGETTTPSEPIQAQTTQTAESALTIPFPVDERLARIFANERASDLLVALLSTIQGYEDTAHPVVAMNTIFQRWIKGEDMNTAELTGSFRFILEHLAFLAELSSQYAGLVSESDNELQF